jgi:Anti-sigma factor NepR
MIEKKTPGPPDAISKSNSVDDSASPAKKRNPNVKDHIGRQLRALYDEVANQPVPDRFMELLNRLEVKRGEE